MFVYLFIGAATGIVTIWIQKLLRCCSENSSLKNVSHVRRTPPCACVLPIPGNYAHQIADRLVTLREETPATLRLDGNYSRPKEEVVIDGNIVEIRPADRKLTISGRFCQIEQARSIIESEILDNLPANLHRVVFVPRSVLGRIKGTSNSSLTSTLEMFGGSDLPDSPLIIRVEEPRSRSYTTNKRDVPIRVVGDHDVVVECAAYLQVKSVEYYARVHKARMTDDTALEEECPEEGEVEGE